MMEKTEARDNSERWMAIVEKQIKNLLRMLDELLGRRLEILEKYKDIQAKMVNLNMEWMHARMEFCLTQMEIDLLLMRIEKRMLLGAWRKKILRTLWTLYCLYRK